MNLFFIHGQDTYRSLERVGEIKKKFLETSKGGESVGIEGSEADADMLERVLLSSGSLFAREQLVIIKGLFKSKGIAAFEDRLLALLSLAHKTGGANTVIFYERTAADRRVALYKKLKSMGREEVFPPLKCAALFAWAENYAKHNKIAIDANALALLCGSADADLWRLSNEMDKLSSHGNGVIKREDVLLYGSQQFEKNIFDMVDAVAMKQKIRAFKLLRDQLESGAEPLYVLSMLARQFRILVLVKIFLERNTRVHPREAASALQLHPFVCEKAFKQARLFTHKKLKFIYEFLCRIDVRIKTSHLAPSVLLDLFLAEVVG